jgi:hypothetical protein
MQMRFASRWVDQTKRIGAAAAACLWLAFACGTALRAEVVTNRPFPGLVCYAETRPEPPARLFVAEIALTNHNVKVRVAPGGPDPDGPGRWLTTLMRPTRIAGREHFDLVINGDFFDARNVKDAEGTNSGFRSSIWAAPVGPAVTDGKAWSAAKSPQPSVVVHRDGRVTIESVARPDADAWELVAGNTLLLTNGQLVPHQSKTRHPRTAVGLDKSGTKLILLVADGRRPGVAVGMSYEELASALLRYGANTALNLDGGGSSVMALRDPKTGSYKILNEPTDGRERAVANVLGVTFE